VTGAEHWRSHASEALFRPVRAANAFEETVERLLQAVRLGVVAPGERLPSERDLASRLGVGRERVRESLAALADAGYLEVRRGRYGGTFVRSADPEPSAAAPPAGAPPGPVDPDVLVDTLTFRHVVETGAAEAAAATDLGAAQRAHLRGLLEETSSASPGDYRRVDSRLHLAVAEVTRSPSLTAAVAEVRLRTNDLLDAIPLLRPNIEHSNHQHEQLVEAILAGDGERARSGMAEHLEGTAMLLRGFLLR
jgi:DNA-binding FadR family transcriptional regulator